MFNKITILGRLSKDPELRKSNSGKSIAVFTVACDNAMKNPDGTTGTTFLTCNAFGAVAELVAKSAHKGEKIFVYGGLQERKYTRQDGSKGSVLEVIVDGVRLLEPRKDAEEPAKKTTKKGKKSKKAKEDDSLDLPDDDLPF